MAKERLYFGAAPMASIKLPATEYETVEFCPTLLWSDTLGPAKGMGSNCTPCPSSYANSAAGSSNRDEDGKINKLGWMWNNLSVNVSKSNCIFSSLSFIVSYYCDRSIGSNNLPTIVYETVNGWLLLPWKYRSEPANSLLPTT